MYDWFCGLGSDIITMGSEKDREIRPGVTIEGKLIRSGRKGIFLQEADVGQAVSL